VVVIRTPRSGKAPPRMPAPMSMLMLTFTRERSIEAGERRNIWNRRVQRGVAIVKLAACVQFLKKLRGTENCQAQGHEITVTAQNFLICGNKDVTCLVRNTSSGPTPLRAPKWLVSADARSQDGHRRSSLLVASQNDCESRGPRTRPIPRRPERLRQEEGRTRPTDRTAVPGNTGRTLVHRSLAHQPRQGSRSWP